MIAGTIDCKTVGFFLKISKEIRKVWREARESHTRVRQEKKNRIFSVSPQSRSLFSASFQTFCLTARACLNTQKYGLFCSLLELSSSLVANQSTPHIIIFLEHLSHKKILFISKKIEEQFWSFDL